MRLASLTAPNYNQSRAMSSTNASKNVAAQNADAFTSSGQVHRQGFRLQEQALDVAERLQQLLDTPDMLFERIKWDYNESSESEHQKVLEECRKSLNAQIENCRGTNWEESGIKGFFKYANLNNLVLSWANLKEANFQCSTLKKVNLIGADLRGADLKFTSSNQANLKEANLNGADLLAAHLSGADLGWTDLKGANLQNTNLEGAHLRGAKLQNADLEGANLNGADLAEAKLKNSNFDQVDGIPINTSGVQLLFAKNTGLLEARMRRYYDKLAALEDQF